MVHNVDSVHSQTLLVFYHQAIWIKIRSHIVATTKRANLPRLLVDVIPFGISQKISPPRCMFDVGLE